MSEEKMLYIKLGLEIQQAFSNDIWSELCKDDEKIPVEFVQKCFPFGNISWKQLRTNPRGFYWICFRDTVCNKEKLLFFLEFSFFNHPSEHHE